MPEVPLTRLLLDASRAIHAQTSDALVDRGVVNVTPGQAAALLLVDRAGTRLTDLSGRAGVTKQTMMQTVDGLAGLGLARRVQDPADGRAKIVKLTARGLRARAQARRAVAAVEARVRRRLGDRRHEVFRSVLRELAEGDET